MNNKSTDVSGNFFFNNFLKFTSKSFLRESPLLTYPGVEIKDIHILFHIHIENLFFFFWWVD